MANKGKIHQVGAGSRSRSQARAEDKARRSRLRADDERAMREAGETREEYLTRMDIEFCCNVAKDLYGTKRCAIMVAEDYGLTEAYEVLLRRREESETG